MTFLGRAGLRSTAFTGFSPAIGSSAGAAAVMMARGGRTALAARVTTTQTRVQAVAQAPAPAARELAPALTNTRVAVVPARASSAPATPSAKKVQKIVTPGQPGLYDRVFTNRNLVIGGAVIGSAAVAAAFAALSAKVGTLAASQIVATSTVAFFQPGLTIFGFALKTGMFMTMNTVVPVVTGGLLPIVLPIVSTVVVTGIAVVVTLYVVNSMMKKLQSSVEAGITTMKDNVVGLPGMVLRQVPGFGMVSSILGFGENTQAPVAQTKAARLERRKNEIKKANEDSGALAIFKQELEQAKTPKQRIAAEKAIALLSGERTLELRDTPAPRGLAALVDHFDDQGRPLPAVRRPGIYTRQMHFEARAAKKANGDVA